MSYPTISATNADMVAQVLLANKADIELAMNRNFLNLEDDFVVDTNGADVSREALSEVANSIQSYISAQKPKNVFQLEELWAEHLHASLKDYPLRALQDPGFWRYLALFPFRSFLLVREPDLTPIRYGGGRGTEKAKWLLPRTYIWGRKTWDELSDSYELTHAVREARAKEGLSDGTIIDFYHSHVVRTAWSASSAVAMGFVTGFLADPVMHDTDNTGNRPSNKLSKVFARLSNNICLEFLSTTDVVEIAVEAKKTFIELPPTKDII